MQSRSSHPELAEIVELHLYDAYFTENLELASHDVLREVAVRAGLPERDVDEVLGSSAYATEVRRDELMAAQLGIHGVPYFVVGGREVVPGCASVEQLSDLLERVMERERASQEAGVEAFGACGPDGCAF